MLSTAWKAGRVSLVLIVAFVLRDLAKGEDRAPVEVTRVAPVRFENRNGTYFADFGADSYGNLEIEFPPGTPNATLKVRLGEKLSTDGAIERNPGGSVNYRELELVITAGSRICRLIIPTKQAHRTATALHAPADMGEITPFRYAEIEGDGPPIARGSIRQLFVHAPFDTTASSFESSDETLNAVWNLCKHTMEATTAFGIYIDGERERRPYEADAYINTLSHFACDLDPRVERATFNYLLAHPTWPTEWSLHMPMLAAADYEATGDKATLRAHFAALKEKLMLGKPHKGELLVSSGIVDWPASERDGYNGGQVDPVHPKQVGPSVNTVVNCFYAHALEQMSTLARALGEDAEARDFASRASAAILQLNSECFDPVPAIYTDGVGSTHASLHANFFPLAFGLVPADRRPKVLSFVKSKGMACSVYAAQYLLEALFRTGDDKAAVGLLTSHSTTSWWHMLQLGSSMTLEAWDPSLKPNLTWNHAWGSAPANLISRFVLGVRPTSPGAGSILIEPQLGDLRWAKGKVPTRHGPVFVSVKAGSEFQLEIDVPQESVAEVSLPIKPLAQMTVDGVRVLPEKKEGRFWLAGLRSGHHSIEAR